MMTSVASRGLQVAEIFGPTFQGEGPSLGRRCSFVRLGGCNLHCSWCDTPYTWDWSGVNGRRFDPRVELKTVSADAVWADVAARGTDMLVITGGEPLLQQGEALVALLTHATAAGWRVEIETAGSLAPRAELVAMVDQFNVSLKLSNSGNAEAKRYRPDAIEALAASGTAIWKFVVQHRGDLDEVDTLVRRHHLTPVWIMPEGTDATAINERARALSHDVLARGWNLTTRLHIQLFGDRRGV